MASKKKQLEISLKDMNDIKSITDNQKLVFDNYKDKNLFLYGVAGTGKTFVALYNALKDVLDPKLKFDIAYANGVDYVFNNAEYQVFLKSIVDYGIKELLIISVSYYTPSFKLYFKAIVKNILIKMELYRGRQFWGFNRSIKEQFGAIKKSGFKNISLVYKSDSTIVIRAKT